MSSGTSVLDGLNSALHSLKRSTSTTGQIRSSPLPLFYSDLLFPTPSLSSSVTLVDQCEEQILRFGRSLKD